MAEENKIYCMERQNDNAPLWAALMNKNESPAELAALMNNNQMMNNPFFYLIFLMLFRNGFWGNGEGAAMNANADINRLSAQVADNNNTQLLRDAISGNATAIGQLASTINCDYNTMSQAICGVKSAIETVGGQVGYSSERVINAVNLGDANIMSKLQDCCCSTKTAILEQGYQNQLANERQTNVLSSAIENSRQATVNGFAQIGYQMAADKAEIIAKSDANTQRILDQMCANTTQALRDELAQKDRELQTQSILNQLRGNGCNCNGCGC